MYIGFALLCFYSISNHCRLFDTKPSLNIYILNMIWFGLLSWHINHCRLFNTKPYIYIYIVIHRQICFVLSELISVTVSSRSWDRNPVDSNAKPRFLTLQPWGDISCEVNFKRLWITITIVYIHPFNGCWDLNSSTKRLAIDANGNTITSSPENSTLRG